MKINKVKISFLLVASVVGMTNSIAQQAPLFIPEPTAAELAQQEAYTANLLQYESNLDALIANRSAYSSPIVENCATLGPIEQVDQALASLSAPDLLTVSQGFDSAGCLGAQTAFKQVTGYSSEIVAGLNGVAKLGDSTQDLVFTPVTPCRIIDTRNYGTGVMAANEVRHFQVYGNATTIVGQGGEGVCTSPRGEPAAVLLNVTPLTYPGSTPGNIQLYPYNTSPPAAAFIHHRLDTNSTIDDNAGSFKTAYFSSFDISIKAKNSKGNVVVNVMGYYYPVDKNNINRKVYTLASTSTLALTSNLTSQCYYTGISISFYAPQAGEVDVNASVYAMLVSKTVNTYTGLEVHIGRSSSSCPSSSSSDGYIPGILGGESWYKASGSVYEADSVGVHGVYTVSPGINRFYLNVRRYQNYGTTKNPYWRINKRAISAIYHPFN